jgi:hypothetical protein
MYILVRKYQEFCLPIAFEHASNICIQKWPVTIGKWLYFSGLYNSRRKLSYFWWFIWVTENCTLFSAAQLRLPKIELFSAVFPQRATEHNWSAGNMIFSLLPPVRPTHAPALLSLVFMPPSTTAANLHRVPPPPSSTARYRRNSSSYRAPAVSTIRVRLPHHCRPSPAPPPPCSCSAASLHVTPPLVPPPVVCHPPRRLLRLSSA